jgi:hypothetical protein
LTGSDNSDGKPTPEQAAFYEENKNRIGQALMIQVRTHSSWFGFR